MVPLSILMKCNKIGFRRAHCILASENYSELTPEQLLNEFRKSSRSASYGYNALETFSKVKDKTPFLEPALKFLTDEKNDAVRAWALRVLEQMQGNEGKRALIFLNALFTTKIVETQDVNKITKAKRAAKYTRFFSIAVMQTLAQSEDERNRFYSLLTDLWNDETEDFLVQAESTVLLAHADGNYDPKYAKHKERVSKEAAIEKLTKMLENRDDFWSRLRVLRALREFPLEDVLDLIIKAKEDSNYVDQQYEAIRALGGYGKSNRLLEVTRKVGLIVRTDDNSFLRLAAVHSLCSLKHLEAQEDLIWALNDENAEVRVQSADSLKDLLKADIAVRTIIQYALKDSDVLTIVNHPERKAVEKDKLTYLIEALRRIDPNRKYSSEVLSKELDGEDKERIEAANYILVDLGGWEAVQKIGQRRKTLETLRDNLREAEKAVTDAFKSTMKQAHRNFAFAMGVNIIIVAVGIGLIILAMWQLIQSPEKLESWLVPGGTGVFGLIISLTFNNSRENAREDLTTLVNVSVIFQGFMRRLKEIDATFEKSYMESQFKISDMEAIVGQIDLAVSETLARAPMISNPTAKKTTKTKAFNVLKGKKSATENDGTKVADGGQGSQTG
jgi:hypothetical protein